MEGRREEGRGGEGREGEGKGTCNETSNAMERRKFFLEMQKKTANPQPAEVLLQLREPLKVPELESWEVHLQEPIEPE